MKMGVRLWFASEKMEPPAPIMKTEYENDTDYDGYGNDTGDTDDTETGENRLDGDTEGGL